MANTPKPGSNPDDDSWGKIASDLFGIQFNDDDDFELPDDDAPVKSQPVTQASSEPVASRSLEETFEAAESEDAAAEPEPVKKSTAAGDEDHDEFWDILESWNWDESTKTPAQSKRTEEPRSGRARQESAPAESRRPRREEPPRREEKRPESSDRPRRRDAEPTREVVASTESEARPARPPRDEGRRERPARPEQRPRRPEADRAQTERPVTERPIAERPAPAPERSSDRGNERRRQRGPVSEIGGDEFGAGVDQVAEPPRSRQPATARKREEPPAPVRKPAPPRRSGEVDDFAGDLFVEDLEEELIEDDSFEADIESNETQSESDEGESDRPRRRRRRRRRGRGRSATESTAAGDAEFEDSPEPEEAEFESDEEVSETEASEDDEEQEDREPRRPRRRRRRRGRRPASPVSANVDAEESEELESDHSEDDDDEDDDDVRDDDEGELAGDDDEEAFVPVSYEGIPTWEEAISYLVITPPTESRGHHRGRGDNHRRDDSRRR